MSDAAISAAAREPGRWHRHPFHVHIGTVFLLLTLAILAGLGLVTHRETSTMVQQSAEELFDHVGREVTQQVRLLRGPIELTVGFGASLRSLTQATTFEGRMERVNILTNALEAAPQVASIFYAYDNGDFFLVRPLRSDAERGRSGAPSGSAFLVQSLEQEGRTARRVALAPDLSTLSEWVPQEALHDPRGETWYRNAMEAGRLVRTPPQVLSATGKVGRTVALRGEGGKVVVGADLLTESLSETLARSRATPSTELAIFDAAGMVLAFHDPGRVARAGADGKPVLTRLPQLSPVMASVGTGVAGPSRSRVVSIDGREWSVRVMPLMTEASRDFLALASPVDELMARVARTQRLLLAIMLLAMALAIPVVWLVARRIAGQLKSLTAQAAAIRRFDFATEVPLQSRIREIHDLGLAMGQMKDTIRKFLDVSIALAAERDFDALMRRVLQEVMEAAGSDGGVIYLLDEDGRVLKCASQRWASGGAPPGDALADLPFEDRAHPIVAAAGKPDEPSRITISSPRPRGLEHLDARHGNADVETIVLPLLGRTGVLVGVVCGTMVPGKAAPGRERMALVQAFAGTAAVCIDQQRLLQSEKNLLNAFIGLVAGAIDAKSPHTGGHCQRVPELAEMLARAAHESTEEPFEDYRLDADDWQAIRIASWLHDCGKVTTPEFVVDKATKLETLHDRIHLVRTRFEVVKREAEIATLRAILAGGDAQALQARLQAELEVLDDEFRFVATCNEGGESMSPDRIERLRAIARRTWQRTLDDRLGVSREERERMAQAPAAALPATEPLLADKPEHIIQRGPRDLMPAGNPWGFRLSVPEHLYNRGEVHNLSVVRGTLTEEERYKINDHIVQTIVMLSQLPFPRHLKGVTEIAGGHHEKVDGTGYPKRLRQEEMSVPARIMAIADIFEALTAADRPYKSAKKLSEAVRIMGAMAGSGHVDPNLFRLFLRSGIYRVYAEKYLPPELVDEVDLAPYLEPA